MGGAHQWPMKKKTGLLSGEGPYPCLPAAAMINSLIYMVYGGGKQTSRNGCV